MNILKYQAVLQKIHERVKEVKTSEEVGVKYIQNILTAPAIYYTIIKLKETNKNQILMKWVF